MIFSDRYQRLLGNLTVVEVDGPVRQDLVIFVPFAGNQDGVPRFAGGQCQLNRPPAVRFDRIAFLLKPVLQLL